MKITPILFLHLALCLACPANEAAPDPIAAIAAYDFGADRAALNAVDESIRAARGHAEALAAIEDKLAAVLAKPGIGPAARDYVCRSLAVIGTARSVPAVAALLADEHGADAARVALERMPFPAAGEALRAALPQARGLVRLGIVHSLGERKEPESVAVLIPLLKDADAAMVAAAVQALGKIGGEAALAALLGLDDLRAPLMADALLRCAEAQSAGAAFRKVLASAASPVAREAAFVGLAGIAPGESGARLLDLLADSDPAANEMAIRLARRMTVPGLAQAAAARLPALPPRAQVPLLALLSDLGDPASRPAVQALVASADEGVRLSALEALGGFPAQPEVLSLLARTASAGPRAEAQAAARSLARVKGEQVDAALLRGAASGSPGERSAFVAALGERQTPTADRLLLTLRTDPEPGIRRAALKALENVAAPEAHAEVVAWMLAATDAQEARDAERLALRLGARSPRAVEDLVAADAKASAAGKELLARCLARRGGAAALRQVRAYLNCGEAALELAAVRALGMWVDAAPLDDLVALAAKGGDARRGLLAVQGALQLLAGDTRRPAEEKAQVCATLMEKAGASDARKLVLGALGEYPGARSTALAQSYAADPQCGAEARAALRRLRLAGLGAPGLTASHNAGALMLATDGKPETRWTTGGPMVPGEWLQLDLHERCLVRRLVLDSAGSPGDYPRGYQVFVSDAPDAWGDAALTGEGRTAVTEFAFDPPRRGRFVKIVQTGTSGGAFWSVHELKVDAELLDAP